MPRLLLVSTLVLFSCESTDVKEDGEDAMESLGRNAAIEEGGGTMGHMAFEAGRLIERPSAVELLFVLGYEMSSDGTVVEGNALYGETSEDGDCLGASAPHWFEERSVELEECGEGTHRWMDERGGLGALDGLEVDGWQVDSDDAFRSMVDCPGASEGQEPYFYAMLASAGFYRWNGSGPSEEALLVPEAVDDELPIMWIAADDCSSSGEERHWLVDATSGDLLGEFGDNR